LYLLIFCSICGRIRTVCPSFAKQKGHIIVASDKACLVESCHPSHVVADFVSFATTFLLKSHLSLTPSLLLSETGHAQVGCKRPHDGFVSLPPCFGFEPSVLLFRFKLADTFLYLLIFCLICGRIRTVCPSFAKQKGHIIVASDKACLVESCHPSHVVADFVSFATTFLLKSHLSLTPSLLLSETGHAQVACSVVNALTTALFRYHPVSGLNRAYCFFHFKLADTFLYLLIFCLIYGRIRTVCPSFAKQKGRRPYGRMKNE